MSLIHTPLMLGNPVGFTPAAVTKTMRAMEVGQYAIAALLTAVGVIRAIADGVAAPVALISGCAILAWHVAGAVLPRRTNSRTTGVLWLIGFAVLWIAAVAVSAEFVWLAFLLWLLAGHLLSLRWGLVFSAVVFAVVVIAPIVHHGVTSYANIFGPLIGGVFAFGISRGYLQLLSDAAERERLLASLTRAQQEMADLQDELALAQRQSGATIERTRISRDIHDTIAQALSSIRLLAHAGRSRADDAEVSRTFAQLEGLAGESLTDVRRIVAALAPAELENDALAAALQRILDRTSAESGVTVELHVDESLPQLPTEVEVALLRTAQSALGNVRVHAAATRVVVSLVDAEDSVRLDITDDGKGFDAAAWEQTVEPGSSSYGLRFMRARLREFGGALEIESTPGKGTRVSVQLPTRVQGRSTGSANLADAAGSTEAATALADHLTEETP
ncbi:sensor histidine kinase [Leucobacter coleopterorum]|uniref:Oxygen sensor histidine kinase NreB n=2 Tax=Leucobacter coleopterorum TaxID=2714933 RepID=A0ABX6K3T9_9MICO|nr:sensor histidine kinase [Leucobacter coleopterorum]